MATKSDVLDIKVNGLTEIEKTTTSVSELKKALKEAKSAALNGDGAAAKKVAELTDKMDDLNDSTKSLQGSGIERLKSSFGLLTDGFQNFDGDKIKTAFNAIGSAMKAIPIFLIIEGVRYLIENFDELSKGNGILAKSLRAIGDVFTYIGEKITQVKYALGLSNSELDKQGDAIKKNADKGKEALDAQNAAFDRQIAVAKASGKNAIEIEKAKQENIIQTNLALAKQIQAYALANGGNLSDEQKKILTTSLENIRNAKVTEFTIEKEDLNKKKELYKKNLDEKKKLDDEKRDYDIKKRNEDANAEQLSEDYLLEQQKINDKKISDYESEQQRIKDELIAAQQLKSINDAESASKEKLRKEKELIDNTIGYTKEGLQSINNLSELFFTLKIANIKKGSKEEEAILRKQFEVNKAFQIANAVINGAQAVTAILSTPDPSLGIMSALRIASSITATALTVAKIGSTQFNSTSQGSGVSTLPSANTNVPNITPQTQTQPTTTFNGNQNTNFQPTTVKAVVVETEMTNSQQRVEKLTRQSLVG